MNKHKSHNKSFYVIISLWLIIPFFNGCYKNYLNQKTKNIITENQTTNDVSSQINSIQLQTNNSGFEDFFDKIIVNGVNDKVDLSKIITNKILDRYSIDISKEPNSINEIQDIKILRQWKRLIEEDKFIDIKKLNAIKVFKISIDSTNQNVNKNSITNSYYLLFIQMIDIPQWVYWSIRNDDFYLLPERSITKKEYNEIIVNGITDQTDLIPIINGIFTLDKQKKSDTELIEYSLDSVLQVTDESKLIIWKDALESDEELIPTKIKAIKIYSISSTQKYQPPRVETQHGDVSHDGKNTFFIMFIQIKINTDWIYWGSFI